MKQVLRHNRGLRHKEEEDFYSEGTKVMFLLFSGQYKGSILCKFHFTEQ